MFSKAKDNKASGHRSIPQPQQVKGSKVKSAPSIISGDMTVHGTLTATGDIQVDGKVEGDIQSSSLTIGEKATVHGDITCEDVAIRGRVIGSVRANRVQLSSTSHVEGDILHQALAVETGAFFEGNCRHSDNPMTEALPAGRAKGGIKSLVGDDTAKMGDAPRPPRGNGGGRAPVEAQSALQRLTGGRKSAD
ncbi:MAG: polymer-forming cytoskeletal protein [Alphaproteobacteria bacterium]|nr:MAG: polymer-forming cytoskeletal protein [Alphaproteobacteria bacterium]